MRCHAPSTRAPLQAKADTTRVAPPAPRSGAQEPARGERAAALPAGLGGGFSLASVPVHAAPVRQPPQTGLPEPLKAGVERLSGFAMDDVRVHRDSPEPARLGALAFAQGRDIHLGPGQDRHLPHEAWHVVQQMQGRVLETTQMKWVRVNDDRLLEAEADRMARRIEAASPPAPRAAANVAAADTPVQKRAASSSIPIFQRQEPGKGLAKPVTKEPHNPQDNTRVDGIDELVKIRMKQLEAKLAAQRR